MGIREEMLEAYDASRAAWVKWRDSAEDDRAEFYWGELNGLLRALCILDEWELVEEIETKSDTGFLHITISDYELGDRIAIYRRK